MPKTAFLRKIMDESLGGMDRLTRNIKLLTADKGNCTATFQVQKAHTNLHGSLHGGFSATLIDNVSNLGLFTHKFGMNPSVTMYLSGNYYKPAFVGDELFLDMKTVKVGKNVAFLEVDIFKNATKELLMKGNHIKFMLRDKVWDFSKVAKEAKELEIEQ